MSLNILFNLEGAKKNRKRVGRGIGTGKGKTCGRGTKGQKSRSGVSTRNANEQTPLFKKLPKRGFNSNKSVEYSLITISDLQYMISNSLIDNTVDKDLLFKLKLIKKLNQPVKLLSKGDKLSRPLTVNLDSYSQKAMKIVEEAGGKVIQS